MKGKQRQGIGHTKFVTVVERNMDYYLKANTGERTWLSQLYETRSGPFVVVSLSEDSGSFRASSSFSELARPIPPSLLPTAFHQKPPSTKPLLTEEILITGSRPICKGSSLALRFDVIAISESGLFDMISKLLSNVRHIRAVMGPLVVVEENVMDGEIGAFPMVCITAAFCVDVWMSKYPPYPG